MSNESKEPVKSDYRPTFAPKGHPYVTPKILEEAQKEAATRRGNDDGTETVKPKE